MNFNDKTAVITGAASGIARATAQHFVQEGMKAVALVDMSADVKSVQDTINREAGRDACLAFEGDVTDRAFRKSVFKELNERFGCVNILTRRLELRLARLSFRIQRGRGANSRLR